MPKDCIFMGVQLVPDFSRVYYTYGNILRQIRLFFITRTFIFGPPSMFPKCIGKPSWWLRLIFSLCHLFILNRRQIFREQSQQAFERLQKRNMDGLIIASKQHPSALLLKLMSFLAPSRPFVVFSPYKAGLLFGKKQKQDNFI